MPRPESPPLLRPLLASLALLAAAGCGRSEILHGLEERQANQALRALEEGGVSSEKRRDPDGEAGWLVEVAAADGARARRILADQDLPRPEPAGLASAFGKGSAVPSPAEERARFLLALTGELARSLECLDGVAQARVHLALAPDDPFRIAPAAPARGSVLIKLRPGARPQVEPLAEGIRALVAGAAPGLDPSRVSIVLAESVAAPPTASAPARQPWLLGAGLAAAALALASLSIGAVRGLLAGRWPRSAAPPRLAEVPALLRSSRAAAAWRRWWPGP
jgi:type III secretion protein J